MALIKACPTAPHTADDRRARRRQWVCDSKLPEPPLDLCDPPSHRCLAARAAVVGARCLLLMLYVPTPSRLHCSLIPHFPSCRLLRVSLAYQSQAIPGYSRRFICSRPQGTWDGLSSTTLPYFVVVPMRPSRMVPEPPRPSTPMRSPHLPFAGAKVHAFPHRTQNLMCRDPHPTHDALTRCGLKCGAGRS